MWGASYKDRRFLFSWRLPWLTREPHRATIPEFVSGLSDSTVGAQKGVRQLWTWFRQKSWGRGSGTMAWGMRSLWNAGKVFQRFSLLRIRNYGLWIRIKDLRRTEKNALGLRLLLKRKQQRRIDTFAGAGTDYWLEHWMRAPYEDLYSKTNIFFFKLHVDKYWVFSSNILQNVFSVFIAEIS